MAAGSPAQDGTRRGKGVRRIATDGMRILITGGAGFMGSNLVRHLAGLGHRCVVFDNLSRAGVGTNLDWLRSEAGSHLEFLHGDVRDAAAVERAVAGADAVYHLAGQTAVTTSVVRPREDFEINALGTLNVLEAARQARRPPRVVFASTNKVYGGLQELEVVEGDTRYTLARGEGVSESHPIEFHTPYGNSKGAADQYVQDYHRMYGLRTAVLRLSCVYGPRQFGTEDQGWVAHFVIAAVLGRALTIYGDGKQVRDILFVDDLVRLYARFLEAGDAPVWGRAYNTGGGARFTLSLLELLDILARETGRRPRAAFEAWRPADQRVYISDTGNVRRALGWQPQVSPEDGVRRLLTWVQAHRDFFTAAPRA
jgi:CDP-paratose 2-epimerase